MKTKTITRQQLAGTQGEAFVKERANQMGFLYSPYGPPEAGIDGLLELRDPQTGEVGGKLVAVQVKTTDDGDYARETDAGFDYLLEERDVAYWKDCNLPVIVVLVHLGRREAFWKSVDEGQGTGSRRLKFDKQLDRFDEGAGDAIAALCVSKGGWGVWFPSLRGGETAHLNLIEVVVPDRIFAASSPFKTGRQALTELLVHDDRPFDDWIVKGGRFMSFRNPTGTSLEHIIDLDTLENLASEAMAFPDDEADEYTVIDLLRRTLVTELDGLLSFNRAQRAFYFPAHPDTIEITHHYTSLKQKTSADVVKKYEKDGETKYVRHHAFEPRFWRLGDQWLLSITPTFVFTWDGFRPDRFAAGRLSGKKQREFNSALLGQFVMWRNLLIELGASEQAAELFDLAAKRDHTLRFRAIESVALPRGVPDDVWRSSEPEQPADDDFQGRLAL